MSEPVREVSAESVLTFSLTADEVLAIVAEWSAAFPTDRYIRTGPQVKSQGAMEWSWSDGIDREKVTGSAPTDLTIAAHDAERGGCTVTIAMRTDLSDAPDPVRQELAHDHPRTVDNAAQSLKQVITAHTQSKSLESAALELICVADFRVGNTVEEVMAAITEMQDGPATAEGSVKSPVVIDAPFEWEFAGGDSTTITGVAPATLRLSALCDDVSVILHVVYAVNISSVPEEGRQLVRDAVRATVPNSGEIWREAIASSVTNREQGNGVELPPWVRWRLG